MLGFFNQNAKVSNTGVRVKTETLAKREVWGKILVEFTFTANAFHNNSFYHVKLFPH